MGSTSDQPAARLTDLDTGHPPCVPTPVITGSINVLINSLPAARQGDMLAPHHPGIRLISEGSASVLINGQPAARVTDAVDCGGVLIMGSFDVLIGDSPSLVDRDPIQRLNIEFPTQSGGKSFSKSPEPDTAPNVSSDTVIYTAPAHSNDTEVHVEPPPSDLDKHIQEAIDYWQKAEYDATNAPAAIGARLMRLNAEAGNSISEGIASLYGTLTNWDQFKAAAEGMYNTVTNPEQTYNALKQAVGEFAELPAEQQGEAVYKMLIGALATGGVGKLGKLSKVVAAKAKTGKIVPKNQLVVTSLNRADLEQQLVARLGKDIKGNPLRQEYETKVAELAKYQRGITDHSVRDKAIANMADLPGSEKALAEVANNARRQLGVEYKNLTPEPLRDYIYEVNLNRYGDPLGPTVDLLVQRGKTYSQIVKDAAKPNPDVNKLLDGFGKWLSKQSDDYVQKHVHLLNGNNL